MVEYSKVSVKLSDTQLKNLKTAVKKKAETALRISLKIFNGNDLPHELSQVKKKKISLDKHFCFRFGTIVLIFLFIDVEKCGRQ